MTIVMASAMSLSMLGGGVTSSLQVKAAETVSNPWIANDGTVERNDACFVRNNTLYCLKGVEIANAGYDEENPAPYYQYNYNLLLEAFGPNAIENNVCSVHSNNINCSASGLYAYADMSGSVYAYGDSTGCGAYDSGYSECGE